MRFSRKTGFVGRYTAVGLAVVTAATAISLAPLPAVSQRGTGGSWRIQYAGDDSRIQLSLEDYDEGHGHSSTGFSVPLGSLEGLSASQLRGSSSDAHFASRVRARDGSLLSVQELIRRRDSGENY